MIWQLDNYVSDRVLESLFLVALTATVLSSAAWLIASCLARNAALRHLVLLSALLGCLAAPVVASVCAATGVSLLSIPAGKASRHGGGTGNEATRAATRALSWQGSIEQDRTVTAAPLLQRSDSASTVVAREPMSGSPAKPASVPMAGVPPTASDATEKAFPIRRIATAAAFAGFVGVTALVVRIAFNCGLAIRLRRLARPLEDERLHSLLESISTELGVRQSPKLLVSSRISIPIAIGLGKPAVILPERLIGAIGDDELRDVLLHESAHLQRGDQHIVLLQSLAGAVYWPIVPLHFLNRELKRAAEELCDNVVLTSRRAIAYGETLLHVAELLGPSRPLCGTAGFFCRAGELERRIASLIESNRNRATKTGRRTTLTVVFLFVGVASAATTTRLGVAAAPGAMEQGVQEAHRDPKTASPAGATLPDDGQQPEKAPGSPTSRSPDAIWVATDEFGDRLPPHATMRLGTVRFRQQGEVTDIAYSIDGKTIATLDENEVLLWEAATGRLKQRLKPENPPPGFRPVSLAFSPNGHEIAVSGGMGVIIIWDLETGVELVRIESEHQRIPFQDTDLSYSPDGSRLAVATGLSVAVYDTISGDKLHSLTIADHRAAVSGIAWSPDGKHIVAGTLEPSAVAWNAESGDVVRTYQTGKERAFTRDVRISDDGLTLYGSRGGSVYEWEFASGRLLREFETGGDFVVRFYVDSEARQLVAGCQDGITRIWDLWEDRLIRQIDGELWIGRSIAVNSDFTTIALGAVYPTIRQWDIPSGKDLLPAVTGSGHTAEVACVAYSPDGEWIASGGPNHQILLWNATTGKLQARLPTESSARKVVFDPTGTKLYTFWDFNGTVRVWSVASQQMIQSFDRGENKVRAIALSPDGRRLVTIGTDSEYSWHSTPGEETCHLWDTATGDLLEEFRFNTSSTESAAMRVDSNIIVTGSANGDIHVMDLTGKPLHLLSGHKHSVNELLFTEDGKTMISASTDQTIRIWDTDTWTTRKTLTAHARSVTSLALSPDGKVLASASGQRSYPIEASHSPRIRIWNIETGEQLGYLDGHDSSTSGLAFSPDGRRLVSAHTNTTLLIWDPSAIVARKK